MRWCGLSLFKFLRYIKEEIFVVLGTSSSESALPLMMRKMEKLGCSKPVVGLVVPMGYSFNLDGNSIYLTPLDPVRRAGDEYAPHLRARSSRSWRCCSSPPRAQRP